MNAPDTTLPLNPVDGDDHVIIWKMNGEAAVWRIEPGARATLIKPPEPEVGGGAWFIRDGQIHLRKQR